MPEGSEPPFAGATTPADTLAAPPTAVGAVVMVPRLAARPSGSGVSEAADAAAHASAVHCIEPDSWPAAGTSGAKAAKLTTVASAVQPRGSPHVDALSPGGRWAPTGGGKWAVGGTPPLFLDNAKPSGIGWVAAALATSFDEDPL